MVFAGLDRKNVDNNGMLPRKRAHGIVINKGEVSLKEKSKKSPPKWCKVKGKAAVIETSKNITSSEGESFDSQDSFCEPEDDDLLQDRPTEFM